LWCAMHDIQYGNIIMLIKIWKPKVLYRYRYCSTDSASRETEGMHCVENVLYPNSIIRSWVLVGVRTISVTLSLIKSTIKQYTYKQCPCYGAMRSPKFRFLPESRGRYDELIPPWR
jgi:hypothetical protein